MSLEIDTLSCRRGGRWVFRDLSFRAEAGEAVLLRGPNGAGKSTLLRVISGMLPPMGGDVRYQNVSLQADRASLQEQIAYAGHLDAVKPALTVRQNLALWAGIFGVGDAGIDPVLDRFGLGAISDRPVAQCSAGQKRRLGLARLPVIGRPLWLLDEPTVSLDADATALVADLIRDHCADGGLVVAATHIDLGLADPRVLELRGEVASELPSEGAESGNDDAFLAGDWT
ncbi:MAG: heme ABC exporter ATP-binding protein CcmA [Pseudomonadota bacterium]